MKTWVLWGLLMKYAHSSWRTFGKRKQEKKRERPWIFLTLLLLSHPLQQCHLDICINQSELMVHHSAFAWMIGYQTEVLSHLGVSCPVPHPAHHSFSPSATGNSGQLASEFRVSCLDLGHEVLLLDSQIRQWLLPAARAFAPLSSWTAVGKNPSVALKHSNMRQLPWLDPHWAYEAKSNGPGMGTRHLNFKSKSITMHLLQLTLVLPISCL